jgi:hypothetical protein
MNWIKIAVGIMRDPRIISLSEGVGVSVPTATGHVVGVLTALPEGCPTGDLSGVSDATIEQWAMWRGKKGEFAAVFRSQLCDTHGVVRSWEKHNGRAIQKAKDAAERTRLWREEQKANAKRMHTDGIPNALRTAQRDETRRDVLHNNQTALGAGEPPPLLLAAPQPAPKPTKKAKGEKNPATWPNFPSALSDVGFKTWLEKLGAVHYGVFRKAFAPIFDIPEADRPAVLPRDAELPRIIELYAVAIRGTRAAQFAKPEACAGKATQLAAAAREPDPERRLMLARVACGTVEEQRRLEMAA